MTVELILSEQSITVEVGESKQIKVYERTTIDGVATDKDVTKDADYSRSDVEKAKIVEGLVTGVSESQEWVLIYYEEHYVYLHVTVVPSTSQPPEPEPEPEPESEPEPTPSADSVFLRFGYRSDTSVPESRRFTSTKIQMSQLEKGNKATDYSPAPEDTDAKIDYIETEFTQTFESFDQRVVSLDGRVTSQRQDLDRITNTVTDNTGRIATTELNINGLQTTVKNKADKTQITQLATQISTKVESATYNSKMTQLDSSITARVTSATYNSQITQLAGQISTKVESEDYNSKMTQLDNAINLRVSKATVIAEINLSAETGTVRIAGKRIQLDGNVLMDTAFINKIKAIDISADRITAGTINAAVVNIINLNASKITAGTFTGANYSLNLGTGTQSFTNPSNGDSLVMNQGLISFFNGGKSRHLAYTDEGLKIYAGAGNTGTSANTSIHLIGGHAYLEFISSLGTGYYQRIEALSGNMYIAHSPGGALRVRSYGSDEQQSKIIAGRYSTTHSSGQILELYANSLSTPNDGNRHIYLIPNGTGSVIIGNGSGVRWNIQASDFVKVSTRESKTDIKPITSKGLDVIGRLVPVSYKKKDKLAQGIDEVELGFIAEDSLEVAEPEGKGIYDSHITAYLVKAVQELNEEIEELKREKGNAE